MLIWWGLLVLVATLGTGRQDPIRELHALTRRQRMIHSRKLYTDAEKMPADEGLKGKIFKRRRMIDYDEVPTPTRAEKFMQKVTRRRGEPQSSSKVFIMLEGPG